MSSPAPDPRDPRPLTGGPLSLDLLNTRWGVAEPHDLLRDRAGYEVWLSSAGLAGRCPADAVSLAATRIAREAIAAAAAGPASPAPEAVAALNEVLDHGRIRRELTAAGPAEAVEVGNPAWLAAWLAADDYLGLLRRNPDRIRSCAHPDCVLFFYDDSQNGRRRWHSMATCGNRAKASRHYARTRGGS
ncbi:CGNR zinc finger domain-containing protein [Streptacidiphilus sp. ASG 303]|uniref:CGNR zinc finger domain-containing protein n=1 Tax=Streptacidiphilus sp. ASG 303 TaxID=2896847 RepID=UPI001E44D5AD|nr:CGNR zinc finger domain-containing protein [Streptacidiphilus sp. ASG 303]MCD0482253.1 CGNR zinc finger domain-containing protein [Streptacidiphilus sp. ASG 303]